jgi:hypothetical protein
MKQQKIGNLMKNANSWSSFWKSKNITEYEQQSWDKLIQVKLSIGMIVQTMKNVFEFNLNLINTFWISSSALHKHLYQWTTLNEAGPLIIFCK